MTLLLHVGYPKTGSTSLQRRVLRHVPDTAIPGREDDVIRPLFRWTAIGPHARVDARHIAESKEWLAASLARPRILSEESILGLTLRRRQRVRRFRHWNPASNLAVAPERLEVPLAGVHVALTVRPQADLLPSMFAEAPPARDLESWVKSMMRLPSGAGGSPLDYSEVAESFASIFGLANVHILPLHKLGQAEYFREFCRGTGVDWAPMLAAWDAYGGTENRRRITPTRWQPNEPRRLRGRIAADLREYPKVRRFLLSRWNLPVLALSALTWRPRPTVELTEALRRAITERFEDSNRRLSGRFGTDLDGAGYW